MMDCCIMKCEKTVLEDFYDQLIPNVE